MSEFPDHYAQLGDLYAELGSIGDWYCLGNHDFKGWYHTRPGPGDWDGEGRGWALGKEFGGIRQDLDRVVYATFNYAPARWFLHGWRPFNYEDGGREWDGGDTPLPEYGDLRAYAPFADIDLADGVKQQRPAGEIPQADIEDALSLYLDAFADLAGDRRHVFALDSVGGAYAFVAPTAPTPIAETFARDGRRLLFDDLTDRANDWLEDVKATVNKRITAVRGTFEPDLLNNKNRLYKAPLSVHSSLDGVVTPVDPDSPTYEYTPVGDVDGETIATAEAWAEDFTGDHRDAVGSLVETLWPDYYADADGWKNALSDRLADLQEQEERNQRREAERLSAADVPDGIEQTDDIDVVNAKIEAIDVRDVARDVADAWDTDPGRDPPRFDPPWRTSDSGTSCYADRDKYVDLQEGANGGGPLTLVARARGIITDSGGRLRGDDYWKAVTELRKLGYDIPYFTGADGTHPDVLRVYEEPENAEDARLKVLRAARVGK